MSDTDESAPEKYLPTASLEILRQRAQLLDEIRRFFHEQGCWEIETPILSHDIVVDAFLEPFATRWIPGGTVVSDGSDTTVPAPITAGLPAQIHPVMPQTAIGYIELLPTY